MNNVYHFHTKFSKRHTSYVPYRFDLDKPYQITPNGDLWDIHQLKDDGVTYEKTARAATREEADAFIYAHRVHSGAIDPSTPNTDMLGGHLIFQSISQEVFPEDLETAKEIH